MALIDKLLPEAGGSPLLPAHQFTASCLGWFIGDWNRSDVISAWSLEASDEAQLDQAKTAYDAAPSAITKLIYALKLERYAELGQSGKMTKSQFKTLMGWS